MPTARERLDRDRVIKTAIDLLDQVGLDGLTLRRLATELGVQAPALYWYFRNKQELLDHMLDAIMRSERAWRTPDPGEAWDAWLTALAGSTRRTLNQHRDGAMLAASTHPLDDRWGDVEQSLAVLVDAGFTASEALRALLTIGNYVSGFTLEEQADRVRGVTGASEDQWEEAMAVLEPFPLLVTAMRETGDPQSDAAFEAGLAIIVDGLRARLSGRVPAARRSRGGRLARERGSA